MLADRNILSISGPWKDNYIHDYRVVGKIGTQKRGPGERGMIVSCTMNLMCTCETVRQTSTHPSHLQIQDPESARPILQGRECWSTEVDESREGERVASRQTIGESLFPTPYYLLLLHRKLNAQAAACCCKPECLIPCSRATVQLRNYC